MLAGLLIGVFGQWPEGIHLVPFRLGVVVPPDNFATLAIWINIWFVQDGYHFCKQNYGVLSIYKRRAGIVGRRWSDKASCFILMWPAMLLPYSISLCERYGVPIAVVYAAVVVLTEMAIITAALWLILDFCLGTTLPRAIFMITVAAIAVMLYVTIVEMGPGGALWAGLMLYGAYSVNHWTTAIGLGAITWERSRASSQVKFLLWLSPTILFGLLMLWVFYRPEIHGWVLMVAKMFIAVRIAWNLWHFLADRWLYRFSDKMVRATIGQDLFASSERLRRIEPFPAMPD